MSSSRNLVGTGLLSLLALVVFQNSALGDEDRTQERNGERPVVLDSNATPQWAPAAQQLVIQAPDESPRIVTVGEDEARHGAGDRGRRTGLDIPDEASAGRPASNDATPPHRSPGCWRAERRKNMWILALPLTALALSVGVYGLLWLIERGGDEYPAKLPLSDKGATEPRRH